MTLVLIATHHCPVTHFLLRHARGFALANQATIPAPFKLISATGIFSTRSATPRWRPIALRTYGGTEPGGLKPAPFGTGRVTKAYHFGRPIFPVRKMEGCAVSDSSLGEMRQNLN